MRMFAALIAAVALGAVEAKAQTGRIENPAWLEQPNPEAFRQNYPDAALAQQIEGRATLECVVHIDATLDCTTIDESPEGWGFGAAAVEIARSFRMRPARRDGRDIEGGRFRNTIRFVQPPVEDDPYADWPEEFRTFLRLTPPPDLPSWDDAPAASEMLNAYPAEAKRNLIDGRVTFSCTVRDDRRLNCAQVLERPTGNGFGAAATNVLERFRVSEADTDFIARHRTEPFLLPVSFSRFEEVLPLNRLITGMQPMTFPSQQFPPERLPSNSSDSSLSMLCTLRALLGPSCTVERATGAGTAIGEGLIEELARMPFTPGEGLVAGDQFRFEVLFGPRP